MGAFILKLVKPILGQILLTLGMSVITYKGADLLVSRLEGYLRVQLYNAPADLLGLLGLAGIDSALSIIFSAFVVKTTLKSFSKIGAMKQ